jgi:hypothetical protein
VPLRLVDIDHVRELPRVLVVQTLENMHQCLGSGLLIQMIAISWGGGGQNHDYFRPPKSGKNRGRCDRVE